MPRLILMAVILTVVVLCGYTFKLSAQDKRIPHEQDYYGLNSSTSNTILSTTPPNFIQETPEQQNVINQLNEARANGDVVRADQLYRQFAALHGSAPVQMVPDPRAQTTQIIPKGGQPQPDYLITNIFSNARPTQSVAVATVPNGAPNAGRIWVAVAVFTTNAPDTIRLFYSDNGGQTFASWYGWVYAGFNMDFNPQESDIELCYDGTDVWLFGVAGFTDNTMGRKLTTFYRFNTTGTLSFTAFTMGWPGNGTTSNLYYNPRITSDNTENTTTTYLYMTCSFDSTTGSTHTTRQKYALVIAPFASSVSINYAQPSGLPAGYGGGFFWWSGGLAANTYIWQDIAHYQSIGNRIMTVYNIDAPQNGHNMYLAWSDNYGATIAGNLILTENVESQWARIAANGGVGNQNLMITYRRIFFGTDWDPYYRNTTTGGITLGSWTAGFIDPSSSDAYYVDVIGLRNANNLFKAAYTQDVTVGVPAGYYAGWNGSSWTNPSSSQVSIAPIDNFWGRVRAGYRYGTTDDCIAIWCVSGGNGANCSRLCQSTLGIGINNNEIPKVYNLEQNYPNPFNPFTIINFSIPKSGLVKLVVFDVLGQEVTVLVNEIKSAGNYSVTFDASSIPSGVYFYKITSGGFVSTKKMVLVK